MSRPLLKCDEFDIISCVLNMVTSQEKIILSGIIEKVLPEGKYLVEVTYKEKTRNFVCKLSGRMRRNRIRVTKGDSVQISVNIYDPTLGTITYRNV